MKAPGLDLADRVELHELAARYGDLIDSRDWPGLATVFTDDVVFDMTDIGLPRVEGLDAVRAHMDRTRHPMAHHITNIYVEDGNPPRLCSRAMLILDDRRAASGRYRDEVARTADGWRIRHRVFVLTRPPRKA